MLHDFAQSGRKAGLRLLIVLLFTVSVQAQFVELTANINLTVWSGGNDDPPLYDTSSRQVKCVVGTNSWLIAADESARTETWWYTGSNLVLRVLSSQPKDKATSASELHPVSRNFDFNGDLDSGTNGPFLPPVFRVAWLAFCSGPFLSKERREVPMLSTLWKEYWLFHDQAAEPRGFPESTVQFQDGFGLPISIDVTTKLGQPLFEYRVKHWRGPSPLSTNVLDWSFPRQFAAVQYLPMKGKTNIWQAFLITEGTLTSIRPGAAPKATILQ